MSAKSRIRGLIVLGLCMSITLGCSRSPVKAPAGDGGSQVNARDSGTSLQVGDPAPALWIQKWVKGEPIKRFESDQVYVVEFWATWCGPCRVGMPHVSEMQGKYPSEVQIVGVTREKEPVVRAFLAKEQSSGMTWDDVVHYRLAIDDDGQTNERYMKAAGQNGIPTAFIVGHGGLIEWIGHPMRMDEPLRQVVDGTWDRT